MAINDGKYRDLKFKPLNKRKSKMTINHREEFDRFVQNMSENTNVHKLRKMKALSNYVGMLAQEVSDDLNFGINKTRPSNDEVK